MKTYNTINVSFLADDDCALEFANMVQALIPKDAKDAQVHSSAKPALNSLEIHYDEHPESPREWDNVGTMRCAHGRYSLGDEKGRGDMKEDMIELLGEHCDIYLDDESEIVEEKFNEFFIYLPLYLYDHSGITMSTGPFSCPWDSGQVGFIYVSRERAEKEYGVKNADFPIEREVMLHDLGLRGPNRPVKKTFATLDELATYYLKGEVETYDQFLRGEVYGYVLLDYAGEELDSCWGFYGSDHRDSGILDHIKDQQFERISLHYPGGTSEEELTHEELFG